MTIEQWVEGFLQLQRKYLVSESPEISQKIKEHYELLEPLMEKEKIYMTTVDIIKKTLYQQWSVFIATQSNRRKLVTRLKKRLKEAEYKLSHPETILEEKMIKAVDLMVTNMKSVATRNIKKKQSRILPTPSYKHL